MFRYFSTISFWTLVSRILGYGRDVALGALFGAGAFLDAFLIAFMLPNLFRSFFAEGALNAGFLSIFARKVEEKNQKGAQKFAGEAIMILGLLVVLLTLLAEIFMPAVMNVIAGGFRDDPEKMTLAIDLGRLIFPYLLLITLTALFSGILQGHKIFSIPAAAASLLNLALWGGIGLIILLPRLDQGIIIGCSVLAGGFIQWGLVFIFCKKKGLLPHFSLPLLTPDGRKMLTLMGPTMLLAGVSQINFLINRILVTHLEEGSLLFIFYAERMIQLPLGLFGVAAGIALLPVLSRHLGRGDEKAATEIQNQAVVFVALTGLPASVALMGLAEPIIYSIFGYGAFDRETAEKTAQALAFMAAGLPAFMLFRVLTAMFFALQDTKTPLRIGFLAAFLNIAVALTAIPFLKHTGVALAVSVSSWTTCFLLGLILHKRGFLKIKAETIIIAIKVVFASLVMMLFLFWVQNWFNPLATETVLARLFQMGGLVICGLLFYTGLLILLRTVSFQEMKLYFKG